MARKQDQATAERMTRITYLMSEEDTGWLKIGCTTTPHSLYRRLQNQQSGNPRRLSIVALWVRMVDLSTIEELRGDHPNAAVMVSDIAGYDLEQSLIAQHCSADRVSDWTTDSADTIIGLWRAGL